MRLFFFKHNNNNDNNNSNIKTINGVTGQTLCNVMAGKMPQTFQINFSYETSMAAEQGSLQCNYICSLRAVEL